ncbi:short-chain dehydrogenase/reductase [Dictyobacter alpinus]|uniref:Short-chain dehydrogenase/reductase n=1 Tax=Dictyobacter alpinus TaxID=2014873 RepID=A0A402BFW1_9CHLR|nr:SDR family oxidoreductase [Dictyobacter alpinus]GCE30288.1 short-chain dehydrogenase/reductase [Dictyobacter alpinus]
MNIRFDGQRALVTGAGKGIGREIALLLSQLGAYVVAVSRSREDLETLAHEIHGEVIAAELGDVQQAQNAARQAGKINLLVNNAGISIPQSFLKTTVEDFDATMAVNVRATMVISQIIAQGMIQRGYGGAIVNISSQSSHLAVAEHTAYCASKGALDQLTRVMALELGPFQIRVNAVNPTITQTPMGMMAWSDPAKSGPMKARIPLGRFAKPLDVAHAVAYLLSSDADMIHGITLPIDGGFQTH